MSATPNEMEEDRKMRKRIKEKHEVNNEVAARINNKKQTKAVQKGADAAVKTSEESKKTTAALKKIQNLLEKKDVQWWIGVVGVPLGTFAAIIAAAFAIVDFFKGSQ